VAFHRGPLLFAGRARMRSGTRRHCVGVDLVITTALRHHLGSAAGHVSCTGTDANRCNQ
jgi:hypothetical protein